MKAIRKKKESKKTKGIRTLKANELIQIRGGDETQKDHEIV